MQQVTLDCVQGGMVCRTFFPELLHRGSNPSQLETAGRGRLWSAQARKHRVSTSCSTPAPLHPWQDDFPLPSKVVIDVSNHTPCNLSSPEGWEILRRNGLVWIVELNRRVAQLDAAQYGMLLLFLPIFFPHLVPLVELSGWQIWSTMFI